MRCAVRKEYNNNPCISTPAAKEKASERLDGSGPHSAPLPSAMRNRWELRKRAALDTDVSDGDELPSAQPSPTCVMDMEVTDISRASPVEELGPSQAATDGACAKASASDELPCYAPPTRSSSSRVILASAANLVRDVYLHLVKHHVFIVSDIFDSNNVLTCASLDPMGVLFSAQTILRIVLTEELLATHGLDVQVRELCAGVLLLCYKLKSESHWREGYSISAIVFTQFMQQHELPIRNDEKARALVAHLEFELATKLPLFKLVDETPHAACEWTLYKYYEERLEQYKRDNKEMLEKGNIHAVAGLRDTELNGHKELMLALSGCYFFYHAACINHEQEVLETMAQWADQNVMGEALAHACLLAIHLLPGDRSVPPAVSAKVARAATLLVQNAEMVSSAELSTKRTRSAQRTSGLRAGATANAMHPCQSIVDHCALQRLMEALKGHL